MKQSKINQEYEEKSRQGKKFKNEMMLSHCCPVSKINLTLQRSTESRQMVKKKVELSGKSLRHCIGHVLTNSLAIIAAIEATDKTRKAAKFTSIHVNPAKRDVHSNFCMHVVAICEIVCFALVSV